MIRTSLDPTPKLVPGYGFFLEGDGHWDVREIPQDVLDNAEFSGYLTIRGYSCTVFETPEQSQWAQKSSGTPAPKGDEAAKDVLSCFHEMALRVAGMRTSYDPPRLTPEKHREIAVSNLEMGIDQRNEPDFEGLDGAIFSYWKNSADTALEAGGNHADTVAVSKIFLAEAKRRGVVIDEVTGKFTDVKGQYPMMDEDVVDWDDEE